MYDEIRSEIRASHLHTWFIWSVAFLIITYRWSFRPFTTGILLPIGLLVLYVLAGQAVAKSISGFFSLFLAKSPREPLWALFKPSLIHAIIASGVSIAIHWVWICYGDSLQTGARVRIPTPNFRSLWITLPAAAIFPLMACLSASALVDRDSKLSDKHGGRIE